MVGSWGWTAGLGFGVGLVSTALDFLVFPVSSSLFPFHSPLRERDWKWKTIELPPYFRWWKIGGKWHFVDVLKDFLFCSKQQNCVSTR